LMVSDPVAQVMEPRNRLLDRLAPAIRGVRKAGCEVGPEAGVSPCDQITPEAEAQLTDRLALTDVLAALTYTQLRLRDPSACASSQFAVRVVQPGGRPAKSAMACAQARAQRVPERDLEMAERRPERRCDSGVPAIQHDRRAAVVARLCEVRAQALCADPALEL